MIQKPPWTTVGVMQCSLQGRNYGRNVKRDLILLMNLLLKTVSPTSQSSQRLPSESILPTGTVTLSLYRWQGDSECHHLMRAISTGQGAPPRPHQKLK